VLAPVNDAPVIEQKHVHIREHNGVYREWKKERILMWETVHVYPGVVE
jgi:hypothetical protein